MACVCKDLRHYYATNDSGKVRQVNNKIKYESANRYIVTPCLIFYNFSVYDPFAWSQ